MKWLTVVSTASLISSASAWSFTWRNAEGEASIETGRGPHACITVNHHKGELFELDGEGEKNINMLMFTTPNCAGEPAGSASEEFSKESSVSIRGFKVVALNAPSTGSGTASSTATGTSGSGNDTSSPATTSSSAGTTVTLSDESSTTASAAATTSADATTTETPAASTTEDAASTATPTESGENAAAALSAGGALPVLAAVVLGFAGLA